MDSSFLSGANAVFISEMHKAWLDNPGGVDSEWAQWFQSIGALSDGAEYTPDWGSNPTKIIGANDPQASIKAVAKGIAGDRDLMASDVRSATLDSLRAIMLIRAYRIRGHLLAKLDPLNLNQEEIHPELDPTNYGFSEEDYDRPIFINYVLGLEIATLNEILAVLKKTYCSTIGVEFMHIQDPNQKAWIQERIEAIGNRTEFTNRGKVAIYEKLVSAEGFEQFLHKKYVGTKRFGLDGGEALIPAIEQILKRGGQLGIKEVVIGMPHRGRLNVLNNVMDKPFRAIISEFLGNPANPEEAGGSGDVKYHMGVSADRLFDDNEIHLSLAPNPSHLEIVDPVVIGRVRAKQDQIKDKERHEVLGILLHGDAAFAGQGVVAETFDFSALRGYRTGGTIHIIVNNQIGFTTSPSYSRSSPYPTDVGKMVMAPILHVNGDDPEAVVHSARIAVEFKQTFKTDVIIDMFCYRRFGHNEGDEPSFTQPLMYKKIKEHPSTREIYANQLIAEGVLTADQALDIVNKNKKHLDDEFEAGTTFKQNKADWLEGKWTGLGKAPEEDARRGTTSCSIDMLQQIGTVMTTIPNNIDVHPKLKRVIEARKKAIETGEGIDWATAEHLAFGSLLLEGYAVRLSGQDSGRGTFSQRHSVFVDQKNESRYIPLANLSSEQAHFEVIDSPLSEASVMGFEYGYAMAEPNALVMWEAQFGDFANGAQVVIDQFISSGEAKWLRMNGLVLLLPHGYEGQGPEHSSARLERYLQLCAEDNMQVCYPSSPANYFHMLRRQLKRDFRKPLIVMTPKSLLRNKNCVSNIDEFTNGSSFHRVLYENSEEKKFNDVERVVLCSGKVFYDLVETRDNKNLKGIRILRLEQLYPFPEKAVKEHLAETPKAEVVWCQEEPRNMGAWTFVREYIEKIMTGLEMKSSRLVYCGRKEAASPATGSAARHRLEQETLVQAALTKNQQDLAAE